MENTVIYSDKQPGALATRPALERLVQDIRDGKIERVVCYKLDRVGRSLTHLALIVDELARLNVRLICTSQGIEPVRRQPVREVSPERADSRRRSRARDYLRSA